MINRKIGIALCLLCLCLLWLPGQAMAASSSDAVEAIIPEQECALTLSYFYEDSRFSDVQVMLYRVASVSADFQYTLTEPFRATGLVLGGIRTNGEWDAIRSTLEAHIVANNLAPEFTAPTNAEGKAVFENLKTGIYLALVNPVEQGRVQYLFDASLITLPGLGSDGRWQYQVSVNAKGEALPPTDSDEEAEFTVLKLWKGDDGKSRPKTVEVEIFCNGSSYQTVTLSKENNWAYSWSAPKAATWTVAERNVPQGYTATVETRQSTFVLTNTWTPPQPEAPGKPPQTGDTTNIMLYVLLMLGSGGLLLILGITGKKSRP